jgi:hypothetical protein
MAYFFPVDIGVFRGESCGLEFGVFRAHCITFCVSDEREVKLNFENKNIKNKNLYMYDLIIIGGGPAGVAAGVYASCFFQKHSLTPCGFSSSTTGKFPFSRPLSLLSHKLTSN